jgi:hypothetical protein
MTRRFAAAAIAAVFLAGPAQAKYDYVRDVLIGNTVEIADMIGGGAVRLYFRADKTVTRSVKNGATEDGTWRETKKDLCSTFASDGQEVCSAKPKKVKVPSSRTMKGKLPDGTRYHVVFTWMKGVVPF